MGPTHQQGANQGGAQSAKQDSTKPPAPITRAPPSAEQRLADYTRALTWLTGGLFVATLLLWWTTRGTLQHLRQDFEAQHRPWIPPDIQLASGWTWTPAGDGRITLRFTLRNTGRSPATNVNVRAEIFPSGMGFPDPSAAQKRLSQSEQGAPIAPGAGMGFTIFPEIARQGIGVTMSLSAADVEKARLWFKETYPDGNYVGFTPIIIGCITYRFLGVKHQTGFILELSRTDPMHPHSDFVLDPAGGNIPIERLRLLDYFGGSAVID